MLYEKTADFIFKTTAKRIKDRKKELGFTYYNIMGYDSKVSYELSRKEYDYNMVQKIANEKTSRNNPYLLTDKYAYLFKEALDLYSYHDLYWGTDDEIKAYSEDLFYHLLEDMKKDPLTKRNIADLLNLKSKEGIYNTLSEKFFEIFYQFTKGKSIEYYDFDIVDDKDNKAYSPHNEKLKFSDEGTLSFKKLDMNIEKFAQERLFLILTGKWLLL